MYLPCFPQTISILCLGLVSEVHDHKGYMAIPSPPWTLDSSHVSVQGTIGDSSFPRHAGAIPSHVPLGNAVASAGDLQGHSELLSPL